MHINCVKCLIDVVMCCYSNVLLVIVIMTSSSESCMSICIVRLNEVSSMVIDLLLN